jgi:hypothetical protein
MHRDQQVGRSHIWMISYTRHWTTYDIDPSTFPADIKFREEICKKYFTVWTFRRTSNARAMNMNVSEVHVNVAN